MSYIAERRQEEKERRRAEILDAAEAVAATESWDRLTMEQVARKARLSRALVYVYFKDKNDLLFGLGERALVTLKQRFEEAITRNRLGLEQILGIGRAYLAFSQEFPVYFEVMTRCELMSEDTPEVDPNEEACRQGGDAVRALMVTGLANGVKDGSIRADVGDLKTVAIVLWGFTHGVLQLAATKPNILAHEGVQPRQLLEQALVMATRSIAAT
jgi:TetR/AcrR family transcriptional regulator